MSSLRHPVGPEKPSSTGAAGRSCSGRCWSSSWSWCSSSSGGGAGQRRRRRVRRPLVPGLLPAHRRTGLRPVPGPRGLLRRSRRHLLGFCVEARSCRRLDLHEGPDRPDPGARQVGLRPHRGPKIAMSIKNSGTNSCHLDLGSAQQVLTISSGQEQYWSRRTARPAARTRTSRSSPGRRSRPPAIAWDRTRSSTSTCDSSRPAVTAGGASYHLQVAVGNLGRRPRCVHPAVGGDAGGGFAVRARGSDPFRANRSAFAPDARVVSAWLWCA